MKNIKYLFVAFLTFIFFSTNVKATNDLNNLDIDIYINEDGSANITEVWEMYNSDKTEIYKPMSDMGNMKLSNFTVTDSSGKTYTNISWDVDSSFDQKAYKNGINYTSDGFELCWGISSYGSNTYTIKYTLSNFVFNTSDAQIVYYKAINDNMNTYPKNFTIDITSFYEFADTLDVWGYGYNGYAYVENGKIELANKADNFKKSEYAVVLVKFPQNTFKNNSTTNYSTFDDVLTQAKEGSKSNKVNPIIVFINAIGRFMPVIIFTLIGLFSAKATKKSKFVYHISQQIAAIDKKEVVPFRDIPCKKDIFRANMIAEIYGNQNDTNIIGAILLKWILNDQVSIVNLPDTMFKKNRIGIDLKDGIVTDNQSEKSMYSFMKKASRDNILESREMERWCKNNYNKFYGWFTDLRIAESKKLVNENLLIPAKNMFQTAYDVSPNLKPEALQLFGLKKFLEEFTLINEKQAIEVKLWKEYLMYAEIFGIADQVAKQFKKLYPEISNIDNYDLDNITHNIIIINNMTNNCVSAADSAREAAARSYSSGGGGFSSGGGGGGSSGGGSGGGAR